MSSLNTNIIANFLGNGWVALMGIAFVPLYLSYFGAEAYGVIGLFATLQATLSILDLGLSATLGRELAVLSARQGSASEMRDRVRTLEVIYWGMALVIGLGLLAIEPSIANYWVRPGKISLEEIRQAFLVLAAATAIRWPYTLYASGLYGLQRQVVLNVLTCMFATFQGVGAVLILELIAPTLQAFVLWQLAVALIQVAVTWAVLWRALPVAEGRAKFDLDVLRKIWRFAAGISGSSILAVIILQSDKILLSKVLTLEEFGYYVFGAAVASSLYRIISPITNAMSPHFTRLVAEGNTVGLVRSYHAGCGLMSVAILPGALLVAFFSKEILNFWTQNSHTSEQVYLVLSILIIGNALNGLINLPNALQLAYGWVGLQFYTNLVAIVVLGPALYLLATYYGGVGAAAVWVTLNTAYILIVIHIMHHQILPNEKWRWYLRDVGFPLVASIGVVALGKILLPHNLPQWMEIGAIGMIFIVSLVVAAATVQQTRQWIESVIVHGTRLFLQKLS
jgi:O-antigen/teichoic acid export membrane protein